MYRDRLYTAEEARKILARASALADEGGGPSSGGETKTLAQLEELASELGIARDLVLRAAGASEEVEPKKPFEWLGGEGRIVVERTLPFELQAEDHFRMVETIRGRMGLVGRTEVLGRSLVWSSETGMQNQRAVSVTFVLEKGHTRVRLEENMSSSKGGLFGGLMGGLGGGGTPGIVGAILAATHSGIAAAIAAVAYFIGVFFFARAIFVHLRRKRARDLEALAGLLATRLSSEPAATTGPRVASADDEIAKAKARLDREAEAEAAAAEEHELEAREAGFPRPDRRGRRRSS